MKILILFFIFNVYAEEKITEDEYRHSDYALDWKYKGGQFLIYDCERMHYVCATDEGFEDCLNHRNTAIKKNQKTYPCAPLKKFETKKLCVQQSYKIVDQNSQRRFCFPK